jgi:hypothetical protein
MINPNEPLLNGGSDGENGQTGRKLVMDYYGPRVPIGGGVLCGNSCAHIDRAVAMAAREVAVAVAGKRQMLGAERFRRAKLFGVAERLLRDGLGHLARGGCH